MDNTVLIVEDDPETVELVSLYLRRDGYRVLSASDGLEGLRLAREAQPDLVILDLMLPRLDGMQVGRILREEADVPIIMPTARVDEEDRLAGLELGADDYVTKPFSPRELVLRVKAVLRRSEPLVAASRYFAHGGLSLDLERHRCQVGDCQVELTAKEFGLLAALMSRPGRVLTREELLDELWGSDITVTHRTVDTHVKRLREKLGEAGLHIDTVRGVGYRFSD